jgi:hypothetical protein
VGSFTAAIISAADGEFVSYPASSLWYRERELIIPIAARFSIYEKCSNHGLVLSEEAHTAQLGAGLINVFDAVHATTMVLPGELILNDTTHFKSQ